MRALERRQPYIFEELSLEPEVCNMTVMPKNQLAMSKLFRILGVVFLTLLLCGASVRAQNTDSSTDGASRQSAAPYPPLVSWASGTETTPDTGELTPDQRPLTGVQQLTLGNSWQSHSLLLPSISVTTQLDTNSSGSGNNAVGTVSYLLGRLDLHHVSGRSDLLLDYMGGGMLSTVLSANGGNGNSVIQNLELSDTFKWQRWSLLLGDEGSYLSESSFGFGGVGGLGSLGGVSQFGSGGALGGNLSSFNPSVTPNQTIPTGMVPQLSNAAISQVEYQLSPRSSWTAAGSYGLQQFFGAGYINSNSMLFQTGYNYQLSPLSTVAVLYEFEAFRFTHLAEGIDEHLVQLSYGRRITGRLSFQLAAGPAMEVFRAPLAASSTQLSWNVGSSLNYQLARTALSVSYYHFLTAGSGVLVGAETNQVLGTAGRNLLRTWHGSVSLGYANNRGLAQTTGDAIQPLFNSWYGAVQLSHQLRPGMALFFAYGANLQGTNTAACAGTSYGSNYITQQLSLGFNWGLRPTTFR